MFRHWRIWAVCAGASASWMNCTQVVVLVMDSVSHTAAAAVKGFLRAFCWRPGSAGEYPLPGNRPPCGGGGPAANGGSLETPGRKPWTSGDWQGIVTLVDLGSHRQQGE
jgi:hypothetical protein